MRAQILPRKSNQELLESSYTEDKYCDPATQEPLDITSFLDPKFQSDYISAENVPDIKERVKIEMEQVAQKVTYPVFLCSLVIQN